jgi:DNA processing protein
MIREKLTEQDCILGLSLFGGIGAKRYQKILDGFGSVVKFWNASQKDLLNKGLSYSLTMRFLQFRDRVDIPGYKISLGRKLIKFASIQDKSYPTLLKEISNPPIVLYYKGRLSVLGEKTIAIIGSRKPSSYGREVTERFSRQLVNRGFVIVSGMARGIDSIAHRVAIGQKGRTIAVLGAGLDYIYPPEHRSLAEAIAKQGALVTEYPPDKRPARFQFPARNRIISGLSLGVLITEGATKSGTKSTAAFAADQSREVFCVPGSINSPLSAGPSELIQLGAKLTTNINDVLAELPLVNTIEDTAKAQPSFDNQEESRVWQALKKGQKTTDQLVQELSIPPAKTMSLLTSLELKGLIKNIGESKYVLI